MGEDERLKCEMGNKIKRERSIKTWNNEKTDKPNKRNLNWLQAMRREVRDRKEW